ncbi:hypothetical protein Btru_075948 [Bulinus truncatus]|nr:hypothetical protein Btru_075948 [Bulinus truncatus]
MLNPLAYGSSCELMAAAELFSYRFRVYRNGEVLYTFGQTSMPIKNLNFTGDDLSVDTLMKRVRRCGSCTDRGKRKKCRKAVANILQTNEFHKDSIAEYSQTNLTSHKNVVDKYSQVNQQVLMDDDAFAKYYKSNPNLNRSSDSKNDPNSEKRLKRKQTCLNKKQPNVVQGDDVAQAQIDADASITTTSKVNKHDLTSRSPRRHQSITMTSPVDHHDFISPSPLPHQLINTTSSVNRLYLISQSPRPKKSVTMTSSVSRQDFTSRSPRLHQSFATTSSIYDLTT